MGKKKKILIVEDEVLTAMALKQQLETAGYEIIGTPSTGEDAVRLAENDKPDLILMDILLKGPMDGISASEEILGSSSVPVVYLTASSDPATAQRANRTGHSGYLKKHVDAGDLKITVAAVIKNSGATPRKSAAF